MIYTHDYVNAYYKHKRMICNICIQGFPVYAHFGMSSQGASPWPPLPVVAG